MNLAELFDRVERNHQTNGARLRNDGALARAVRAELAALRTELAALTAAPPRALAPVNRVLACVADWLARLLELAPDVPTARTRPEEHPPLEEVKERLGMLENRLVPPLPVPETDETTPRPQQEEPSHVES
jgi:hypothetical protein